MISLITYFYYNMTSHDKIILNKKRNKIKHQLLSLPILFKNFNVFALSLYTPPFNFLAYSSVTS